MNRLTKAVASALPMILFAIPISAHAQGTPAEHMNGSLGFHTSTAPVGVRWWFGAQKVGVDLGFGYGSSPSDDFPSEKLKHWAIDGGVPIVFKSWSKVHVLFRPGVLYESAESDAGLATFSTVKTKTLTVSGEIEAEVFLADNFSVSASHGVAYTSIDPPGPGDNITSFETLGKNFTDVGFHVYFFGGGTQ